MSFAYREMFSPGIVGVILGIFGALTLIYALVGPYGTRYALNLGQRMLFCVLWSMVGTLICLPTGTLVLYLMRSLSRAQIAMGLVPYVLVAPLLCAPVPFAIIKRLFRHDPRPEEFIVWTYVGGVVTLGCIAAVVYYIVCLRLSRNELLRDALSAATDGTNGGAYGAAEQTHEVAGPNRLATLTTPVRPDARVAEESPASTTVYPPRAESTFFQRVPREFGRDLVYMRVSGHYLRVVTTLGSKVIILRLADAVRELGGLGMQTHRSYWVAFAHIGYIVRRDRRFLLHVTGGDEIPVSRTFLPDVQRQVSSLRCERSGHGT